jgi:hypothetical protein
MAHPQWRKKMAHQKRAHPRKMEHQTSVLHDFCRTVSLEASPFSLEPQKKKERVVKVEQKIGRGAGGASEKVGKRDGQQKIQEKHQRRDTDRKGRTH